MTWVDSGGVANDIDAAAGETPKMEESYGGSFGRSESDAHSPRSSNSHITSCSNNSGSSSSNSSGSSTGDIDGSDTGSRGGGAAGDCTAELPKGEAHRLQSWNNVVIFPSRTRDGNQNRGEEPASSSSYAFLADEVKRSQGNSSEQGIGGYDFDTLSESFVCQRPWMDGEPPSVLDLKHAKELEADFNNDVFSLVCSVVDGPGEIAMAVRDETLGESEFRLPSGPVRVAETPLVTVAGVNRSIHKEVWYQAIKKEMEGHIESNTFTVVDELPHEKKVVASKWMLPCKSDKNGKITRTKARLVAEGFMQSDGLDYLRTSEPTPAAAPFRIVMAIANELQSKVYHPDVAQAFTKVTLDHEVYMKLPGGFGDLSGKYVQVRLEKALYGL